jgi:hypothetical protein
MIEAIIVFEGSLPPVEALRVPNGRPGLFDARAVHLPPEMLASYIDDPGQPLVETERNQLARAHVGLKLVSRTAETRTQVARLIELTSTMFAHGACAVVLPAALRIFGETQLARAFIEPTEIESSLALLVHHHVVARGELAWLHTHGMQHFGLPDVECVEPLHFAGQVSRTIRAVLHRLVVGPPLRFGDVVEHDTDAAMYRLVSSPPVEGHEFGGYGVARLHRVA